LIIFLVENQLAKPFFYFLPILHLLLLPFCNSSSSVDSTFIRVSFLVAAPPSKSTKANVPVSNLMEALALLQLVV
jgi:hypothetical protein